ncbi:MAG: DUF4129 domain-containing protein [Acidothermus sp.]|nr:DUF4129 domain-containing protein [Acidothermus sp.]
MISFWSAQPPPITADSARAEARAELAKPRYHQEHASLISKALQWLFDRFASLLDHLNGGTTSGLIISWVIVVLLILALAAAIAVVVRSKPFTWRRRSRQRRPSSPSAVPSVDHRMRAREYAAAGRYAEAVREWLRAVAVELEACDVLTPRPGRTPAELGREAAPRLADAAPLLERAVRRFEEIWYGGDAASAGDSELFEELDARIRRAVA